MNLELLNPFEQSCPEIIQGVLEYGFAVIASFNRMGTHLAVGCNDGKVVVWDMFTRGVVRVLEGHVAPITAVCWSRDSRILFTASMDSYVYIWNLVDEEDVYARNEAEKQGGEGSEPKQSEKENEEDHQRKKMKIDDPQMGEGGGVHTKSNNGASSIPQVGTRKIYSCQFFGLSIGSAQFHPRSKHAYLVVLNSLNLAVAVNISTGEKILLPTNESESGEILEDRRTSKESLLKKREELNTKNSEFNTITATYDKRGRYIFTGNSEGGIKIIDAYLYQIVHSISCGSFGSIKSITFNRSGDSFLVNCADRNIRLFRFVKKQETGIQPARVDPTKAIANSAPSLAPAEKKELGVEKSNGVGKSAKMPCSVFSKGEFILEKKFQDLVNRIHWKKCCFSTDGDYVVAGSSQRASHNIYLWERNIGNLTKILEGPKEGLLDIVWHPVRPIIASISAHGIIFLWTTNFNENWSAFAPDFKELEENVEYIEREDEFDANDDIADEEKRVEKERIDAELIDITTVERIAAFEDGEEENNSPGKDEEEFETPEISEARKKIKFDDYGSKANNKENSNPGVFTLSFPIDPDYSLTSSVQYSYSTKNEKRSPFESKEEEEKLKGINNGEGDIPSGSALEPNLHETIAHS